MYIWRERQTEGYGFPHSLFVSRGHYILIFSGYMQTLNKVQERWAGFNQAVASVSCPMFFLFRLLELEGLGLLVVLAQENPKS